KFPCQDADWDDLEQYTRFCYTDVIPLYGAQGGLLHGGVPYLDYALEYPVVTGFFMTLIGVPVHALGTAVSINEYQWFYHLTALGLFACAIATAAMLLSLRRRRTWDVAMFALSPALLVTATVNWDLLAIGLTMFFIYFWAQRRPVLAGMMLGLAVAAKFYPLFLAGPLLVLALRTWRWRAV